MTVRRLYADSSALVKLIVAEPESAALQNHLADDPVLVTSALARVEVSRAATIARGMPDQAEELLSRCELVSVDLALPRAVELASVRIRVLDAIHLASAERVEPDAVLVYDERLASAARERGLVVLQPGR